MKKIISLIIILALALSLYACGSKTTDSTSTTTAPVTTTSPEPSYAAMLVVSINPSFRLYLDKDGTVINMESGNTDADAIKDKITYEGKGFEEVIKSIILVAHAEGYLGTDGKVTFNIYEARGIDADMILTKAQAVAGSTAAELEVEIEVDSEDKTVDDPIDDVITTTSPTEDTTTTTTQQTTTTTTTLNPNDYIQEATEYIGNFKEIDGGLRASAIHFEGEFCVITERYFTSEKPEDDIPSITFNGKEYYSEGGGQNPYYFRLTDTEVIVTIPMWDNATADTVTLRLVLQSEDTLKVIESRSTLFPAGTILSSDINKVLR